MKQKQLSLSVVFIGTALTACASVPEYQPTTTDTARVRFALKKGNFPPLPNGIIDMGETLHPYIYNAGTCENQTAVGRLYLPESKKKVSGKLNMPLGEFSKSGVNEVNMDAGVRQRVTVQFGYLRGGPFAKIERCGISTDMTFDKNKDYEFLGVFENAGQCEVKLSELISEGDTATRRHLKTFTGAADPVPEACIVK